MICEKCAGEIKTVKCKICNREILPIGDYCYLCGADLNKKADDENSSQNLAG